MAGTRQRGGWLSSAAATCLVLALIWRGGNGDLTALPQKSDPSDAWERDLLPRLSQMYGRTNTKSKRAVDQCARMQLQPVSADLQDKSLHVEGDWGKTEWQVEEGVGVEKGGGHEEDKNCLNDGTRAEKHSA